MNLVHIGRKEEAIRQLQNADLWINYYRYMLPGHLLCDVGRRDAAFAAFKQSLLHEGGNLQIQLRCLHDIGSQEKELEVFREACRTQPANDGLLGDIVGHLREHRLATQEVELLQEAVRLRGNVAGTRHLLADALDQLARYRESEEQYQEALRLRPDNTEIRVAFARMRVRWGKLAEAATEVREAIRLVPADSHLRQQAGTVLAKTGHRDEALAEHRRALELSTSPGRANELAWLLGTSADSDLRDGCPFTVDLMV